MAETAGRFKPVVQEEAADRFNTGRLAAKLHRGSSMKYCNKNTLHAKT